MGVLVVAVRSIPERIGHPFYAREALERNEGPAAGIVAADAGERCDDPDVLIGVECTWCGGEEATPPTAFLDLHNFAACWRLQRPSPQLQRLQTLSVLPYKSVHSTKRRLAFWRFGCPSDITGLF